MEEAAATLAKTLVLSHLDYCNMVYTGIPDKDMVKLQHVQNMAACLVLKASPRDSITECLKTLHWLPCKYCVIYKVLLLVHKAQYGDAPQYMKDLFQARVQKGRTHDPEDRLLVVPFTQRKTFVDRAISIAGPKYWNSLLNKRLCTMDNEENFKAELKMHLFAIAFQ